MKFNKHKKQIAFSVLAISLLVFLVSCGEEPGRYQDEKLILETPVSSKAVKKPVTDAGLDLGADEKSNFHITRIGALVPWAPWPFFDYYLEPLPLLVPVAPDFALIEYVHPFYAVNPFLGDDDGLPFRPDDD